jgi:hypothetical protein
MLQVLKPETFDNFNEVVRSTEAYRTRILKRYKRMRALAKRQNDILMFCITDAFINDFQAGIFRKALHNQLTRQLPKTQALTEPHKLEDYANESSEFRIYKHVEISDMLIDGYTIYVYESFKFVCAVYVKDGQIEEGFYSLGEFNRQVAISKILSASEVEGCDQEPENTQEA